MLLVSVNGFSFVCLHNKHRRNAIAMQRNEESPTVWGGYVLCRQVVELLFPCSLVQPLPARYLRHVPQKHGIPQWLRRQMKAVSAFRWFRS